MKCLEGAMVVDERNDLIIGRDLRLCKICKIIPVENKTILYHMLREYSRNEFNVLKTYKYLTTKAAVGTYETFTTNYIYGKSTTDYICTLPNDLPSIVLVGMEGSKKRKSKVY